ELEAEARRRWPVIECIIVHRLGAVPLKESSVAIAVSTPHRADAFAAANSLTRMFMLLSMAPRLSALRQRFQASIRRTTPIT
ncbi:MAG TPA: molybdenum cofactor biosynthesis protein MoaE, partial [Lacipirellulaceae bacterium]|nr:molybdenum cofactor biosynthesis protein MoaE [Lacipirellulaceae bacterium]